MAWGFLATWWVGAFLGTLLAYAARGGDRTPLTAREIVPMVAKLLAVMAVCATIAGVLGYFFATLPAGFELEVPHAMEHRFLADWWTHIVSYASGFVGALVLCFLVWRSRELPEPLKTTGC